MRIISRGSSIPNRTISTSSSPTVGGTSRYRTSLASRPRPSNKACADRHFEHEGLKNSSG